MFYSTGPWWHAAASWIQTLDIQIRSQIFYHCAIATGPHFKEFYARKLCKNYARKIGCNIDAQFCGWTPVARLFKLLSLFDTSYKTLYCSVDVNPQAREY